MTEVSQAARSAGRGPPAFEEPVWRTLRRTVGIAVIVGVIFAVARRNASLFFPSMVIALWFSLGGHVVEVLYRNQIAPRLATSHLGAIAVRVAVWMAGGTLLLLGARLTANLGGRSVALGMPAWYGGVALIVLELVVHGALLALGRPNAFNHLG